MKDNLLNVIVCPMATREKSDTLHRESRKKEFGILSVATVIIASFVSTVRILFYIPTRKVLVFFT